MNRRKTMIVRVGTACVLSLPLAAAGCRSASPTATEPPTGGRELVLHEAAFVATVGPILTSRGCDNVACHGGGLRGTFQLSPADAKDYDFDFVQARLQVDAVDREASNLLLKPLDPAAGGVAHTAPASESGFLDAADPDFQAIRAWILGGELR